MRRRATATALGLLLLLLGTAGCATIPQAGTVQTAGPTAAADDPNVTLIPVEPRNGEDPKDIVQGFVLAAVAGADFTVARKYLTAQASKDWDPTAQVLVHQQGWTVSPNGTGRFRLVVPVAARVSSTGQYTEGGTSPPLDFRVTQVAGQWRISKAPPGIVLPQDVFTGYAKPVELQFFDPGWSRLVPDLRWFPAATGRDEAVHDTAIVRALLAGPAAPLRSPVTATAFPAGTLLDGAVEEAGGTAVVRVTTPGGALDGRTTTRMQQQLAGSLEKATSAVRLVVDGRDAAPARALALQPSSGQDPVVLAGGRFGTLSAGQITEDGALGRRIAGARPTAVTVSASQGVAAVQGAGGVAAVTARGSRSLDTRPGLVAPTLDQRGWVYSVPQGDPTGLRAYRATGGRPVALSESLGGTLVTAIEASPDGTRMLVVVETGSGPTAYVAGIERAADGTPTRLTRAHFAVAVGAEQVLDGTWYDSGSVAILTGGTDAQSVVRQVLGGLSSRLGGLTGAVSVSGPSSGGVLALLDSGAIYQRQITSSLWEVRPSGSVAIRVLAVQR